MGEKEWTGMVSEGERQTNIQGGIWMENWMGRGFIKRGRVLNYMKFLEGLEGLGGSNFKMG